MLLKDINKSFTFHFKLNLLSILLMLFSSHVCHGSDHMRLCLISPVWPWERGEETSLQYLLHPAARFPSQVRPHVEAGFNRDSLKQLCSY